MTEQEMSAWISKNCKFAQMRQMPRKPFEATPPIAPPKPAAPAMAPKGQTPLTTQRPQLIDLKGPQRNKEYQNIINQPVQQQDPAWAQNLDPKARAMYDQYKKTNNQRGIQMMQQMHQTF